MDPTKWSWRPYLITALILTAINLFGPNGLIRWVVLEQERLRSAARASELAADVSRLKTEIDSFRHSRIEQERRIRDTLGWLKPRELSVEIHSEESAR